MSVWLACCSCVYIYAKSHAGGLPWGHSGSSKGHLGASLCYLFQSHFVVWFYITYHFKCFGSSVYLFQSHFVLWFYITSHFQCFGSSVMCGVGIIGSCKADVLLRFGFPIPDVCTCKASLVLGTLFVLLRFGVSMPEACTCKPGLVLGTPFALQCT